MGKRIPDHLMKSQNVPAAVDTRLRDVVEYSQNDDERYHTKAGRHHEAPLIQQAK